MVDNNNIYEPPSAFYKALALLLILSLITFALNGLDFLFNMPTWFDCVIIFFIASALITGGALAFVAKASDFEDLSKKK